MKVSKKTNIPVLRNRISAVFGRFVRLRQGPIIIKINPNVDDTKNLGNRSIFSQKSDIY
jgi:hypothetical protein